MTATASRIRRGSSYLVFAAAVTVLALWLVIAGLLVIGAGAATGTPPLTAKLLAPRTAPTCTVDCEKADGVEGFARPFSSSTPAPGGSPSPTSSASGDDPGSGTAGPGGDDGGGSVPRPPGATPGPTPPPPAPQPGTQPTQPPSDAPQPTPTPTPSRTATPTPTPSPTPTPICVPVFELCL